MTGTFGGTPPGDMRFEVRREKPPDVCELSRYFIASVALVKAETSVWLFLPLPLPPRSPLCSPSLLLGLPQSLLWWFGV